MTMITTKALTDLERRVLALLNESGEEYVSALVNSIFRGSGDPTDIDVVRTALNKLMMAGMVEFARTRDERKLTWQVLSTESAIASLGSIASMLSWSNAEKIWEWTATNPRLVVLLTPDGKDLSKRVLEEFGWKLTEPICSPKVRTAEATKS